TARRNDRGNPASVGQARIEDGLRFRDVVAEPSRDVFDSDKQRAVAKRHACDLLNEARLFNKHLVWPIDHDFADGFVEDEVLDRFEERKDGFKAVHQSSPAASCSKYDLFGSL